MLKNLSAEPETSSTGFNPWVRKIPWRREWQPTPIILPGEFHGQGSLVGYSPQGLKESDTTEQLTHTRLLYSEFILKSRSVHLYIHICTQRACA